MKIKCEIVLPSTNDVNSVTFAAFRRPAGRVIPILSSFSLSILPPFFDFALKERVKLNYIHTHF